MKVALYARVSTQRQAQALTVEQEIERLMGHARQQGLASLPDQVFRDDGYSGASLRRPGLDRLRDRAAARSVNLVPVLVTAPDRLARNYVHQVLLLGKLQGHGCDMQFLDRPMSQDPHDQLLLEIRGAVAEYERTLITERRKGATPFRQQDWYRGSGPAMRCWRRLLSIARHLVGGEGTDPFILTPGGNVRYDGGKAQGVLMAPDR